MKVTSETLPERQVKLQIEVGDSRQTEAMEQAFKRLAPSVQIRGFRSGKAPRALIEKQLGHHRLLDEAMEILIPIAYREAVEEQALIPAANPAFELVSHEPLVFTATVPLEPIVELGDVGALRVPRPPVVVKDEDVAASIEDLRRRYGSVEPVDRPAAKGDLLRGSVRALVAGDTVFSEEEVEFRLTDENLAQLPGLVEALVGMTKNEEKEITVAISADAENPTLAGKTTTYQISVLEVKEEKAAALNDDFAKSVGEGFESLAALRTRIEENVREAQEQASLRAYESEAVDALVEQASLEFPAVLVEHEVNHILEGQADIDPRDPQAQALYVERLGKSEEEVKEGVRAEAEMRLKRTLVLSKFAEAENISVEDADVEAEIDAMAGSAGEQAEAIKALFANPGTRETLRHSVQTRKTIARLVGIASADSEASTAAAATAAKKPAAKPRRSAPRKAE